MAAIEIQTTGEGKRLEWVTIYTDSDTRRAVEWVDYLLIGARNPKPNFRILDQPHGKVIGAWQEDGYEENPDQL